MDSFILVSFIILCFSASFVHAFSMVIKPEVTRLARLNSDPLRLECIVTDGPVDVPTFSKDGQLIGLSNDYGFKIVVTRKVVGETSNVTTVVLTKDHLEMQDQGIYECSTSDNMVVRIDVFVVTCTTGDAVLPDLMYPLQSIQLQCTLGMVPHTEGISYNFSWEHNNETLLTGDHYHILENGSLQINKPTREDLGEYQCKVVFFPDFFIERQSITPHPSFLKAGPAITFHDNNQAMSQSDDLVLKCEAHGYPVPEITWLKDGDRINTTQRIVVVEYKMPLSTNSKLNITSLEKSDQGTYQCLAENAVVPFEATASMIVTIKDTTSGGWSIIAAQTLDKVTFILSGLLFTQLFSL